MKVLSALAVIGGAAAQGRAAFYTAPADVADAQPVMEMQQPVRMVQEPVRMVQQPMVQQPVRMMQQPMFVQQRVQQPVAPAAPADPEMARAMADLEDQRYAVLAQGTEAGGESILWEGFQSNTGKGQLGWSGIAGGRFGQYRRFADKVATFPEDGPAPIKGVLTNLRDFYKFGGLAGAFAVADDNQAFVPGARSGLMWLQAADQIRQLQNGGYAAAQSDPSSTQEKLRDTRLSKMGGDALFNSQALFYTGEGEIGAWLLVDYAKTELDKANVALDAAEKAYYADPSPENLNALEVADMTWLSNDYLVQSRTYQAMGNIKLFIFHWTMFMRTKEQIEKKKYDGMELAFRNKYGDAGLAQAAPMYAMGGF
jgi:hypothetical protein